MQAIVADCLSRVECLFDIARFENLDHDWPEICRHIGVEPFSIAHENKTDRRDYRSYYTDETRELVARRFARTIERFGYEF